MPAMTTAEDKMLCELCGEVSKYHLQVEIDVHSEYAPQDLGPVTNHKCTDGNVLVHQECLNWSCAMNENFCASTWLANDKDLPWEIVHKEGHTCEACGERGASVRAQNVSCEEGEGLVWVHVKCAVEQRFFFEKSEKTNQRYVSTKQWVPHFPADAGKECSANIVHGQAADEVTDKFPLLCGGNDISPEHAVSSSLVPVSQSCILLDDSAPDNEAESKPLLSVKRLKSLQEFLVEDAEEVEQAAESFDLLIQRDQKKLRVNKNFDETLEVSFVNEQILMPPKKHTEVHKDLLLHQGIASHTPPDSQMSNAVPFCHLAGIMQVFLEEKSRFQLAIRAYKTVSCPFSSFSKLMHECVILRNLPLILAFGA